MRNIIIVCCLLSIISQGIHRYMCWYRQQKILVHLVPLAMAHLQLLFFTILYLFSDRCHSEGLNVGEYHSYMYQEINKWMNEFQWLRLGRDFCLCENYKSKTVCDVRRKKAQIQCLDGPKGSKLLVKMYGTEAEIQTKYDPTPSRGISFIRSETSLIIIIIKKY